MAKQWMIYGAYGYSGRLIAEEAKRQGLTPLLAGRNIEELAPLAKELALPSRAFDLSDTDLATKYLSDIDLVLHCAGPFSQTAKPMLEACLKAKAHYLDITGEIEVFTLAHQYHQQAVTSGILICPGVGFDVIPTDCLALALSQQLPNATHLALGFDSRSGFSKGTAKTAVEGLASGGKLRRNGRIETVPLAFKQRRIDFGDGEKLAMTIPWGDVATAFFTTQIPNIEVFIPSSPKAIKKLRKLRLIRPILGLGIVQRWLKKKVDQKVKGPKESVRQKTPTYVWGEVKNQQKQGFVGRIKTANGYELTKTGSLAVVNHLLQNAPTPGYSTPAKLMGAQFVTKLPGSGNFQIEPLPSPG